MNGDIYKHMNSGCSYEKPCTCYMITVIVHYVTLVSRPARHEPASSEAELGLHIEPKVSGSVRRSIPSISVTLEVPLVGAIT